jgi:hypothetical protein
MQIKADELPRFAKALNVHPCAFFEEAPRAQSSEFEPTNLIPPLGVQFERWSQGHADFLAGLSPARAAVVQRVLQGLDEAGVE